MVRSKFKRIVKCSKAIRERGIETLEWIGMSAVILTLLLGMLSVMPTGGQAIGAQMHSTINNWVEVWSTGGQLGGGLGSGRFSYGSGYPYGPSTSVGASRGNQAGSGLAPPSGQVLGASTGNPSTGYESACGDGLAEDPSVLSDEDIQRIVKQYAPALQFEDGEKYFPEWATTSGGSGTPVYYNAVRAGDYLYVDYWFYYKENPWGLTPLMQHKHDLEHVLRRFRVGEDGSLQPDKMWLSAHDYPAREVACQEQRPLIYVAEGSHAMSVEKDGIDIGIRWGPISVGDKWKGETNQVSDWTPVAIESVNPDDLLPGMGRGDRVPWMTLRDKRDKDKYDQHRPWDWAGASDPCN
jgi:hypothetical protein